MRAVAAQQGQSNIEFIIVFLIFAGLLMGLFEMTRVFRTKHLLNTATFLAARAGAISNARLRPMNGELANGMAPLFMHGARSAAGLVAAQTRARALVQLPGLGVRIVSPNAAAFDAFKVEQRIRRSDEDEYRWQDVIPNDNLRWRPSNVKDVEISGATAPLNIQDANLLKVRALWCHRLIVPALDAVIFAIVNTPLFLGERQQVCNAISNTTLAGVARGYYLAITADATLRMQSAVVQDDLP